MNDLSREAFVEAGRRGGFAKAANRLKNDVPPTVPPTDGSSEEPEPEPFLNILGPQEQSDQELSLGVLRWVMLRRPNTPPYVLVQAAEKLHSLSREVEADTRIDTITRIMGEEIAAQVRKMEE